MYQRVYMFVVCSALAKPPPLKREVTLLCKPLTKMSVVCRAANGPVIL